MKQQLRECTSKLVVGARIRIYTTPILRSESIPETIGKRIQNFCGYLYEVSMIPNDYSYGAETDSDLEANSDFWSNFDSGPDLDSRTDYDSEPNPKSILESMP